MESHANIPSECLARAHAVMNGGLIFKLTMSIPILAGGSYLDIRILFGLGTDYVNVIFKDALILWINNNDVIKITIFD